jgi:hypothetical protein
MLRALMTKNTVPSNSIVRQSKKEMPFFTFFIFMEGLNFEDAGRYHTRLKHLELLTQ